MKSLLKKGYPNIHRPNNNGFHFLKNYLQVIQVLVVDEKIFSLLKQLTSYIGINNNSGAVIQVAALLKVLKK